MNLDLEKLLNKEINHDISERIKYFNYQYYNEMNHIFLNEDDKIYAILAYQNSYSHKNTLHLEYISIDPEYRGQGLSKTLLKEFISIAIKENKNITYGSLSEDGELKIKNQLEELCKEYNINLV